MNDILTLEGNLADFISSSATVSATLLKIRSNDHSQRLCGIPRAIPICLHKN